MADLIDNPVINSPFAEPQRHFRFAENGITDEIVPEWYRCADIPQALWSRR